MRTIRITTPPANALLAILTLALFSAAAQAQSVLLEANSIGNTVGASNAVTGATISAPFIGPGQGLDRPHALALDSNNRLFVANFSSVTGFVGEYNASTGATINANFIPGLSFPSSLALDGNNRLFVARSGGVDVYNATTGALIKANFINTGTNLVCYMALDKNNHLFSDNSTGTNQFGVGEYDATTGATINATFISDSAPRQIALDAFNHLFLSHSGPGLVGEYDATTGATINGSFVPFSGNLAINDLALDGSNHLFASQGNNTIGEYDATTGATINANFVTGLSGPEGLLYTTAVPEPDSLVLAAFGFAGVAAVGWRWRAPRKRFLVRFKLATRKATGFLLAAFTARIALGKRLIVSCRLSVLLLSALFLLSAHTGSADGQVLLVASPFGGDNIVAEYNPVTGGTISPNFLPGIVSPYAVAVDGNNHLFVVQSLSNTVGEYNAATGATINATFVSGQSLNNPWGIVLDGHNHLFVSNYVNNTIGEYDATTGATIKAAFINSQGLNGPTQMAIDGNNHLFVANYGGNATTVGEYDATTGATINAGFISGLDRPGTLALDGLGHIFVGSIFDNTVGEYDATTGATINAAFISRQAVHGVAGLAFDGNNHLFVLDASASPAPNIGEYNATTGATIVAPFINVPTSSPNDMIFVPASVPEPSAIILATLGFAGLAVWGWRLRKTRLAIPRIAMFACTAIFLFLPAATHGQIYVTKQGGSTVGAYTTSGTTLNAALVTGVSGPSGVAMSGGNLFVTVSIGGKIGEYDAATGAPVNTSFVTGLSQPWGLAVSGENLFVANTTGGTIGEYDAATGATVNAAFISGLGYPAFVAVSGGNLFVADRGFDRVGEYNATTGATVNASLVTGFASLFGIAVSGSNLYVADDGDGSATGGSIGLYNAVTGATVNRSFVTGLGGPNGLALLGGNLFVANSSGGGGSGLGSIGEYDATTGSTVNATLVSGLANNPFGIAVVPEPSSQALAIVAFGGLAGYVWMRRRRPTPKATAGLPTAVMVIVALSVVPGTAHGQIFVTNGGNGSPGAGSVGKYDATTGATLNAALVTGLSNPIGIAVSGSNLLVANNLTGTIGEYDATTGATINAALVAGLNKPQCVVVSGTNVFVASYDVAELNRNHRQIRRRHGRDGECRARHSVG
jgi:hypothetical protein